MKDLLQYTAPLLEKAVSTLKNLWKTQKIGVHQQEYDSSLKIDFSLISVVVSTSREKLGIIQYCFQ